MLFELVKKINSNGFFFFIQLKKPLSDRTEVQKHRSWTVRNEQQT